MPPPDLSIARQIVNWVITAHLFLSVFDTNLATPHRIEPVHLFRESIRPKGILQYERSQPSHRTPITRCRGE